MPVLERGALPVPDEVISEVTALAGRTAAAGYVVNAADFGTAMRLLLSVTQYVMSHDLGLLAHRHALVSASAVVTERGCF